MMRSDLTSRQVTDVFNCPHSTPARLFQRFVESGVVAHCLRPDQSRVTTQMKIVISYCNTYEIVFSCKANGKSDQKISLNSSSNSHSGQLHVTNFKSQSPAIGCNNLEISKRAICTKILIMMAKNVI